MRMKVTMFFLFFLLFALQVRAERIKELADIAGVRDNQLVGYGLVVGLAWTGDGSRAQFTVQGLANMLENMGVHVPADKLKVKNVASVMVSAALPPFARQGQKIDVQVSSMGDARSLSGGTLLATPLKGLDGRVYVMAQGQMVIGGTGDNRHLNVARISDGGLVEREVGLELGADGRLGLNLKQEDFTTANRMARAINGAIGTSTAHAVDGATVEVTVPKRFRGNEVSLIATIENLEIKTDSPARVILDERTGTVVMGGRIRLSPVAVAHGKLTVSVGGGKGQLLNLKDGSTLADLVTALNSVGASPREMVAIFQAIKAAGALKAELEII